VHHPKVLGDTGLAETVLAAVRFVVEKVGSSPLPGDARPCVFLQGLHR